MLIDIFFAIIAGYGFYIGFSRGIIQTIFIWISYVFGLMAAFKFGPATTNLLEGTFNTDNPLWFLAGFLIAFLVTMMLIRMISRGMEGALQTANINVINQAAGGFLVSSFMILVYSVILWFGDKSHLIQEDAKRQSLTYTYIQDFPSYVWEGGKIIGPTLENFWDHSVEFMDKMEDLSLERTESRPSVYDIEEEED